MPQLTMRAPRLAARFASRLALVAVAAIVCARGRAEVNAPSDSAAHAFANLAALVRSSGADVPLESAGSLLAPVPAAQMLAYLQTIPETTDAVQRTAGLAALNVLGTAEELALVLRFASDDLVLVAKPVLARIVERDAGSLITVDYLLVRTTPELQSALLEAVERRGGESAARLFSVCAMRSASLRCESLARWGCVASKLPAPIKDDLRESARTLLALVEPEALPTAIHLCGRQDDEEAIPQLLGYLRHETSSVRAAARWSMGKITRLRLGDRPDRWHDWYATERRFWREEADTAFAALRGNDAAAKVSALLAIGKLHTQRDRLTREVRTVLGDGDPRIVQVAASTLAQLRSELAPPASQSASLRKPKL